MKKRRLLLSSILAITAVAGASYGVFEYWVNLKANMLPKSVTQGKLAEVTTEDAQEVSDLASLLNQSPLPWHHRQAQRFKDLSEVAEAAHETFNGEKVNQLQVGKLLTLQQEMENYIQRYPDQAYAAELHQELPSIQALITFFPIIKSSASDRSVDSALRASRRGATLAALVLRRLPEPEMVADNTPAVPVVSWTKAENDVLYDYSQALQAAERDRLGNDDRLKIGHQVCSWLANGQGYWSVRSMFDSLYKNQVAGDYYHNRDAYIRFGTERLCPQQVASLVPPPDVTPVRVAKATEKAVNNWNAATNVSQPWIVNGQPPQYVQPVPVPFVDGPPGYAPGFPGGLR